MDIDDLPGMVSTRDLAVFLDVSEGLLAKWRSTGIGPPWVKVSPGTSGLVRYPREDLRTYLSERRRPAPAVTG
jgi:hypothetical protein